MIAIEPVQGGSLEAGTVAGALAEKGYFSQSSDVTLERFREVAGELGEVFYEADVKMGGDRPRNYQLPAAIDFHTDHVSAEIAAWYCLEREADGGAMQFLDLAPVLADMSAAELDALSRIRVPDNAVWTEGGDIPLYREEEGRRVVHYVPWLDLRVPDAQARAALEKFQTGVRQAKETALIEFDIRPGELVFLDNHRVMHGRAAIPTHSKRNLKRLWIRSRGTGDKTSQTM